MHKAPPKNTDPESGLKQTGNQWKTNDGMQKQQNLTDHGQTYVGPATPTIDGFRLDIWIVIYPTKLRLTIHVLQSCEVVCSAEAGKIQL